MLKTRPPYPPELRRQMVELVRAGRSIEELAREFEPSTQAIRNWVAQADRDDGRRSEAPKRIINGVSHFTRETVCSQLA